MSNENKIPKEIVGRWNKARVYTDNIEDGAIKQLKVLCNQKALKDSVVRVMPDVHEGKGCTIGTTIKLQGDSERTVIPNLVGVDIGCGIKTIIFKGEKINFKKLDDYINEHIPSGFDIREKLSQKVKQDTIKNIDEVCDHLGIGIKREYHYCSIGTLGGGNHYIEIGLLPKYKNFTNLYVLTIHTGSRNLGLKACIHYQDKAVVDAKRVYKEKLINKWKEKDPSKIQEILESNKDKYDIPKGLEFLKDEDFDKYVKDMKLCQKVAVDNRNVIAQHIMEYLNDLSDVDIIDEFDTKHNYLDTDRMIIRKGAISAEKDEIVVIPLNMKDGILICRGKGNKEWNYSAPHGAGRAMSRSKAKKEIPLEDMKEAMQGIQSWSLTNSTIDEAPQAYKPSTEIIERIKDTVDVLYNAKPLYNFKAH